MDYRINGVKLSEAGYVAFYTGPERRSERRREKSNERVNSFIRNLGLEQRVQINRRQSNTSWLLISELELLSS